MLLNHQSARAFSAAVTLAGLIAFTGPAFAQDGAKAAMKNAEGQDVGTVTLSESDKGVTLKLALKGLPSGEKAFHIHETGKCEPPFKSAGDHYNPTGAKHGKEAEGGPHAGDMENLKIADDGTVSLTVVNEMVTLKKGEKNSVFDEDGSAIVVHAKADDYKSQPSGDAGDRIACGVIQ